MNDLTCNIVKLQCRATGMRIPALPVRTYLPGGLRSAALGTGSSTTTSVA
jgi:hypothetical protein